MGHGRGTLLPQKQLLPAKVLEVPGLEHEEKGN